MFVLRSALKLTPSFALFPSRWPLVRTMSTLKQQLKSIRIQREQPKAEIASLLSDQFEQLANLNHYSSSVSYLEKNEIGKSYNYLEHALTEAKAKFPESVNLHMFIMNRMSILQKIVGDSAQFTDTLQQIFFMCLSLKGEKSLETIKHLHNYMVALALSNPQKLSTLIQFLQQSNLKQLLKKSDYLLSISQYLNNQKQQSIANLQSNIKNNSNNDLVPLYFKINNLCWFKMLGITNGTLEIVPVEKQGEVDAVLKELVHALIDAEKLGDLKAQPIEIQKNLAMTTLLTEFVDKSKNVVLLQIKPNTILLNSHSPIIVMNIAHALYLMKKYEQAALFMKIALETSINLQEPYRLGLGIILLSKINQKLKLMWEQVLVDMLKNKSVYSPAVIKECLLSYSRFLFIEGRFYEAEEYAYQAESVQGTNLQIEGLVLPDFDFSF